jgi:hypothetical protein
MMKNRNATAEALSKAGVIGVSTQPSSVNPATGVHESDSITGRRTFQGRGGVPLVQGEKTKAYADQIMKAFAAAAPAIGGPAVSKALVPSGNITADFDGRAVHNPAATSSPF